MAGAAGTRSRWCSARVSPGLARFESADLRDDVVVVAGGAVLEAAPGPGADQPDDDEQSGGRPGASDGPLIVCIV